MITLTLELARITRDIPDEPTWAALNDDERQAAATAAMHAWQAIWVITQQAANTYRTQGEALARYRLYGPEPAEGDPVDIANERTIAEWIELNEADAAAANAVVQTFADLGESFGRQRDEAFRAYSLWKDRAGVVTTGMHHAD